MTGELMYWHELVSPQHLSKEGLDSVPRGKKAKALRLEVRSSEKESRGSAGPQIPRAERALASEDQAYSVSHSPVPGRKPVRRSRQIPLGLNTDKVVGISRDGL